MKKKVSNRQFAEALYAITLGLKGEKLQLAIKSFIFLLARIHKTGQIKKIIEEFVRYSKKQEGITEIIITSSRKLDDTTLKHVCKVFGDKVEEELITDPKILGGLKIQTDDKILDASLKTQLNNLQKLLAN